MPLKKTAVPSSASDFRPIALLSFLSKVLEKIVHTQIIQFLTSQKILDLDNYAKELQLLGIEMENRMFVPFADSVTNLGVVMDSKLNWK